MRPKNEQQVITMAENKIDPELLRRYLEGKCDPDEIERVEHWYSSLDPEVDEHTFDAPVHFFRIKRTIGQLETQDEESGSSPNNLLTGIFRRYVTAAIVVLVCGLGIYLYTARSNSRDTIETASLTTFENKGKQIQKQLLPDGSTIWLQPGAKIIYTSAHFASKREVTLEGDAFFDIAKDESSPFTVSADELRIQVLGTSFHIRATSGQPVQEVTVISGKVRVAMAHPTSLQKEVALLPKQQAVFEVATGVLSASTVTAQNSTWKAWQPASLGFADTSLDEAVRKLEEKFAVSIHLENTSLKKCLLTATFEDLQLSEILETISLMLDLSYEIKGDAIVLKGAGCGQ
jgi:transmembrane sensor